MNIDDVRKQFGLRVQFFRKQKGYTQEVLGELVGISTEQVSNIERATSRTRIETAASIAKALDVRLADLFDLPMFDTRSKKKTDAIKEHLAFLLKQDEAFIKYIHEQAKLAVAHGKK